MRSSVSMSPCSPAPLTWWTILRISLEERLVYRGDFALGTLMRFLPIVTQVFLWAAVFSAMEAAGGSRQIVGYSYHDIIAYYLLTMITRAFSSMPGLATGIARDIRDGTVKKYLIQPIDMLGFLLLYRRPTSWSITWWRRRRSRWCFTSAAAISPAGPRRRPRPSWPRWRCRCAGLLSRGHAGHDRFWFLEVNSLLFVYMLLNFFFSGHMFPIDMLPGVWGRSSS